MLFQLQAGQGTRRVIPEVEEIRRALSLREEKLDDYWHQFMLLVTEYTPRVIGAVIVLLLGFWLIKRIAVLAERAMVRRELEISLRTFLRSLISIGLKIVLIVTVAGMIGIGTASFVTILGAAGLAIGLALQGSLSNFAGGVLILIFKPFKVGDVIEAGGQTGEVKEIQIFNTILLTGEHRTVILPNGPLSNGTIVNNTRHGDIRLDIALVVSKANYLTRVKQVIEEIIERDPRILKQPKPSIIVTNVSDNAVTVNVRPFCIPSVAGDLQSELNQQLKEAFEINNFRAPVQERIIHTIKES